MTIVDVSEWNPNLPADCTGAIIRLSHGPTLDAKADTHVAQAKAAKVPFGFYSVPESGNPQLEAGHPKTFLQLPWTTGFTLGFWCDYAVGDLPAGQQPSTAFFDVYRSILDSGLYTNGAGLSLMPEYARYERLWYAGTNPPPRWLMRQNGKLDAGVDIDVAADLLPAAAVVVRPQWESFSWPNP